MMMKLTFVLTMCALLAVHGFAQPTEGELLQRLDTINTGAGASPAPGLAMPTPGPGAKPPTEITATKEATYDEKTHVAVFIGEVRVNDPQFKISCDKLTATMRDSTARAPAPSPAPKASPATALAKESPQPGAAKPGGGGGLKHAIAEGHVVIIQDKPAADGQPPQHSYGRAQRAEYDSDSGDVTLTGWPQVQQGINMQIATEESTVMVMNRDGHTMRTKGPTKTVIQDQPDTNSKSQ